jgi:hypothetical protein
MGICAVAVELKKINVGLRAIIREIVFMFQNFGRNVG